MLWRAETQILSAAHILAPFQSFHLLPVSSPLAFLFFVVVVVVSHCINMSCV